MNSTQSTTATPALITQTRGPWVINGEGGIVARIHYFGEAAIYVTAPTTSAFDGHAAERATADAHLIAAAPDLLASLKQLIEGVDECWMACNPGIVDAAQAAIDKAEGRL